MVKAISDYCDAARKVEEEYHQTAINACMVELIGQMNRQKSFYRLTIVLTQYNHATIAIMPLAEGWITINDQE